MMFTSLRFDTRHRFLGVRTLHINVDHIGLRQTPTTLRLEGTAQNDYVILTFCQAESSIDRKE